MTISLGWVRTRTNGEQELVFASDSRVRFAGSWDCCPKLFPLPRMDCVLCFAGDTAYAYPFILQSIASVENHIRAVTRAMALEEVRGHLLRILNNMVSMHEDAPVGYGNPELSLIFGGYCWKRGEFLLWLLKYNPGIRGFNYIPAQHWEGGHQDKQLLFIGDYRQEYYEKLTNLLRERNKLNSGGFDMEPLEVLRDMLEDGSFVHIGGLPQVLKVFKHLNVRPYAIYQPSKDILSFNGRPLLKYETIDHFILNIETMKLIHPRHFKYTEVSPEYHI
ncbi:hypothetical protein ACT8ZS_36645 [Paenibacillus sp. M.A.Huq-84]